MTTSDEQRCCVLCGQPLSERERNLCDQQAERFDHQDLCLAHQRRFCGCPGVNRQILP